MSAVEIGPLRALVAQLQGLDVDLPAEVLAVAGILEDQTTGRLADEARDLPGLDVLHTDRAALIAHIREHAAGRIVFDRMAESAWQVCIGLAQQAGDLLATHAEEIIDQLRPAFTKAAAAVHAASKTGIRPGITPADVIDLGSDRALTAWRTLPEHAATLDRIASARLALSDALGIAPHADQYGAAFAPDAPRWDAGDASAVHRWLRLSASQTKPLTLLSVAASELAADVAREAMRPAPIAASNAEARVTADAWLR